MLSLFGSDAMGVTDKGEAGGIHGSQQVLGVSAHLCNTVQSKAKVIQYLTFCKKW